MSPNDCQKFSARFFVFSFALLIISAAQPSFAHKLTAQRNPVAIEWAVAEELYDADNFEDAIAHYKTIVLMQPTHECALEGLGNSYLLVKKPNYELALDYANKTLAINSKNTEALLTKAWALNSMGRFTEALPVAVYVSELEPAETEAFECIGDAYRGMKHYDEALKADNKRIKLDPKDSVAFWDRAETYKGMRAKVFAKADRQKARALEKAEKSESVASRQKPSKRY